MRRSLLFAWIAFSALALIALNTSVLLAWIEIRSQGKLLRQIATELMRVDRQSQGISEDEWAQFQQQRTIADPFLGSDPESEEPRRGEPGETR